MTAQQYKIDKKAKTISEFNDIVTKDINFIGIDRSLASTGIAVVKDGKLLYQNEISVKNTFCEERIIAIIKRLLKEISKYKNVLVCMEAYSYGSKFGNFFDLGELGGACKIFFKLKKVKYLETEPTTLKKFVSGKGNTNKNLMPMLAAKKFNCQPIGGDAADAISCAYLAYNSFLYLKENKKYSLKDMESIGTFLSLEPKKKKNKRKTLEQLSLEV